MNTEKTSSLNLGLLWFGAAVSIAEILTGALLAPLGFIRGMLAMLLGHIIGCGLLLLTGFIGAKSGLSAIESTRISFGKYGSYWFSILNVVQLLGWTAVMILNGAKALNVATPFLQNQSLWCLIIGALICLWIIIGIKNLTKINVLAVGSLFVLMLILGYTVFSGGIPNQPAVGGLPFGAAVELAVTMPLSWLPLISDYTRWAKRPKSGTAASAICYTAGSCVMYAIGLGAALYAGTDDIAAILVAAGLGFAALLIVILSTVTTTFLDAWSGGVSMTNLSAKVPEKWAALGICLVGVLLAVLLDMGQYESFLYFIGSVFAPLFAVLMADYFFLGRREIDGARINAKNMIIWAAGFVLYRLLLRIDSPVGTTLPTMAAVAAISLIVGRLRVRKVK